MLGSARDCMCTSISNTFGETNNNAFTIVLFFVMLMESILTKYFPYVSKTFQVFVIFQERYKLDMLYPFY